MINDKVVVGAMCVSENLEILKISIPNLLKHSDWILLLLDNESKEVEDYVLQFQKENYDKVWVRRSSIPHKVIGRSGEPLDYHRRWKAVKGIVRDEVFVNLRRILQLKQKGFDKIDVLLFPDSDEIFTDCLPELLDQFSINDYKAIALKMVHVVNDMFTIKNDIMRHHVHIFKWRDDLCGLPWQFQNQMHPVSWSDTMYVEYYSVHLCYLTNKMREWRNKNWKNVNLEEAKLLKLDRVVTEYYPEEIEKKLCEII